MCVLATLLCHREPLYAMEAQCTRCFHALICTDTVAQHRVDRPRFECAEVWLALQMTQTHSLFHSSPAQHQHDNATATSKSRRRKLCCTAISRRRRPERAPGHGAAGAARSVATRPAGTPARSASAVGASAAARGPRWSRCGCARSAAPTHCPRDPSRHAPVTKFASFYAMPSARRR